MYHISKVLYDSVICLIVQISSENILKLWSWLICIMFNMNLSDGQCYCWVYICQSDKNAHVMVSIAGCFQSDTTVHSCLPACYGCTSIMAAHCPLFASLIWLYIHHVCPLLIVCQSDMAVHPSWLPIVHCLPV